MKLRTRLAAGLAAATLLLAGMLLAGPLLDLFDNPAAPAGGTSFQSSIQIDPSMYASEAEEDALIRNMAIIDADRAAEIVLAAKAGATVINIELANINGSVIYEIDLEDGAEFFVDAGNGQILAIE